MGGGEGHLSILAFKAEHKLHVTILRYFKPLPTKKVPPFVLVCDIHFWLADPKSFLQAPKSISGKFWIGLSV